MKIFIQSNDNFIINFVKRNYVVDVIDDGLDVNIHKIDYDIVIFDNINKENIENYISNIYIPNYCIVNLTRNNKIENIVNISFPFKISVLKEKIDYFINYFNNNITCLNFGKLNINKNTFVDLNQRIVQFTQKETEFINYLIKNKDSTKNDLLKNVWQTKILDNRIVESTTYNIKQKMEEIGINNFIEYSNGYYKIREAL